MARTIVRDAREADIASMHRLIGQLGYAPDGATFRTRFETVMSTPTHRVIVAEQDDEIVGVLHAFERPALEKPCEVVVQALIVDKTRRGSGVGASLMKEAETWAVTRGLSSTALYTRIDRDAARAFYERIGYRLIATSHLMGRS